MSILDKEDDNEKMTTTLALTTLGLLVPSIIIRGLVFTILWGWFVVPLGIAAISIAHAIGLTSLIHFVFMSYAKEKHKNEHKLGFLVSRMLIVPFVVLFFAWIIHLFM